MKLEQQEKSPALPGFFTRMRIQKGRSPYFDEDFLEPLLDEVDLRAEDFADDFFAPLFELERDELDFFAPDLEAPDLEDPDFEALFDELFLLVAGDFAIADVLSFPSKRARESHLPPW